MLRLLNRRIRRTASTYTQKRGNSDKLTQLNDKWGKRASGSARKMHKTLSALM